MAPDDTFSGTLTHIAGGVSGTVRARETSFASSTRARKEFCGSLYKKGLCRKTQWFGPEMLSFVDILAQVSGLRRGKTLSFPKVFGPRVLSNVMVSTRKCRTKAH
jgi:hypothetical protein